MVDAEEEEGDGCGCDGCEGMEEKKGEGKRIEGNEKKRIRFGNEMIKK